MEIIKHKWMKPCGVGSMEKFCTVLVICDLSYCSNSRQTVEYIDTP